MLVNIFIIKNHREITLLPTAYKLFKHNKKHNKKTD